MGAESPLRIGFIVLIAVVLLGAALSVVFLLLAWPDSTGVVVKAPPLFGSNAGDAAGKPGERPPGGDGEDLPRFELQRCQGGTARPPVIRGRAVGAGGGRGPVISALQEAEDATSAVIKGEERSADLSPQNAYIRRLQNLLAQRYNLTSRSQGQ